ncbi:hypothetical protein WBJ53_26195 [Spirosoma sp. SC4-14]|uniref:hypothetical protein n=1 Tax=Spirosoma sp. SC4-14 TaxID=3128900 RepID=UPI0030D41BD6
MILLILLQHVADKPAAVAIADSGNSALVQTALAAIVSGVAGFAIRSLIVRPAEKVEQYEKAELKAIADSLAEHKAAYLVNLREWTSWREHQSERTTRLELQQKLLNEQLAEKIKDLTEDVAETKGMAQDIRESLAGLKAQMDQTIKRWTA